MPPDALRRGRAAAALVLLLTAGCASVPTSGPPRTIEQDRGKDTLSQPYVRLVAQPPKQDATPEEIVKGFQAAMASFDDPQLRVARQYLTAEASRRWKPWQRTRIYDEGKITTLGRPADLRNAREATVTLKGAAVATIDSEDRYTPASGAVEETFRLVRDRGQWRIALAPDARLLSSDDLQRAYRQVDLCYPPIIPTTGLVVDRVWVPIDPSAGFPETLVRRLLAGPTSSIKGAVDNAFPSGTALNHITVEADTVVVDFTSAVESVPADRIDAMKAQLVWSLGELVTGRTVEIRVNGEPFRGVGLRFKLSDVSQYDPNVVTAQAQAYYMLGGRLHRVRDKGGGEPVAGPAGEEGAKFTEPAVSGDPEPRIAALMNGDGVYVTGTTQDAQWQRWIAGRDLTAPSWDRYGAVWTAERTGPHQTRVWQAVNGRVNRVSIPSDLANAQVKALRVARDGARVAMITDEGLGTTVKIGTVIRTGEQTRIDDVRTLIEAQDRQEIKEIAWQDAADLLVLTKGKGGQELATWSVTEGVPVTARAIKPDPQAELDSIAGAPGHVLAGADKDGDPSTDDSEVRTYNAEKREWSVLAKDGAADPLYPLG